MEKTRSPRFLDDPCLHAPLFDPGGLLASGLYNASDAAFRLLNDVGSAVITIEALSRGLQTPCVRFAAGVAPGPRNTRFRLVANLCRFRTCTCWVAKKVSVICIRLYDFLLHQALPGAISH